MDKLIIKNSFKDLLLKYNEYLFDNVTGEPTETNLDDFLQHEGLDNEFYCNLICGKPEKDVMRLRN